MTKNKSTKFYDQNGEPTTLWNPGFIMILILGFATGTANQMVNPLLSKYAVSLGSTLAMAGMIVGLERGMAMFMRPLSGAASDLLNRKYVMIFSVVTTGLAFLGYLLSSSIPMVIICRLLQGVGFAFMGVARTAFATNYMPEDKIGEGVSLTTFGTVLSQMTGPSVGLWVSDVWGYRACFMVALFAQIIGGILLALIPYKKKVDVEKDNGKPKGRERLRLSNLISVTALPYALLAGLFSMGSTLVSSFMPLLGDLRGLGNVGIYFTAYSIFCIVIRPLSGRLLDRKGLTAVLVPAYIAISLSMLFIGYANGLVMIAFAGILKAFGHGGGLPSIQAASIKRLGREKAGVSTATLQIGQDFMGFIAPSVGGFIVSWAGASDLSVGYSTLFTIAAILMFCGIPLYFLIKHLDECASAKKISQNQ